MDRNRLKQFSREHRSNSTKAEIRLWCELLRGKKMMGYSFLRQYPIGRYIVDFYCKNLKLAIEADGITHIWDETHKKDIAKERFLKENGIELLRFEDSLIMNDIRAVGLIVEARIAEKEQTSPLPPSKGD